METRLLLRVDADDNKYATVQNKKRPARPTAHLSQRTITGGENKEPDYLA